MSKLYELAEQYKALEEMLYDGEVEEQLIWDSLEGIDAEIEEKADNYAKIIKNMNADVEMLKKEEERLYCRRKALENRSKGLKDRLEENMRFMGKTKFKTALFSFNIQKNGGKQPLEITENLSDIPMKFLVPQEPVPNKEAIREYLANHTVEWAELRPYGESLRIR